MKTENLLLVLFLVESLCCHLACMFYSKLCKIKFIIVCSMQRESAFLRAFPFIAGVLWRQWSSF